MTRSLFAAAFTLGVMAALVPASTADAADNVICAVTTSTSAAATTELPATGTCSWSKGSVILIQCTTDVYIDTNTVLAVFNPDGGTRSPDGGTTGGVASSADEMLDFTNAKDAVPLYLNSTDQHVSVLAVSSAGSCKFMKTQRRRPY